MVSGSVVAGLFSPKKNPGRARYEFKVFIEPHGPGRRHTNLMTASLERRPRLGIDGIIKGKPRGSVLPLTP